MSHTSPKNWDGKTPCPRCVKWVAYQRYTNLPWWKKLWEKVWLKA